MQAPSPVPRADVRTAEGAVVADLLANWCPGDGEQLPLLLHRLHGELDGHEAAP